MKRGWDETRTHDYRPQGTTDLFTALNVVTGEVVHDTKRCHRAKEVLAFFKFIEAHAA